MCADASRYESGGILSDIIDFMERMGGDAQLSQASNDELAVALSATDVAPELQSAVLAGDAQRLGALLGTKPACMLVAPPIPPGPGPSPARPSVPLPPPPGDDGEDEIPTDHSGREDVIDTPAHRREPPSA